MKITFVIQDLFALGAQYVTALMVRGFVNKGYDVDLIVSQVHQDLLNQGELKPFEIPDCTRVIVLPSRKAHRNVFALRHYLKHTDSGCVIAMSTNYTEALAIASIGLRSSPLLMNVEHSGSAGVSWTGELLPPDKGLERVRHWLIYHQYDILTAVSRGTADALMHFMPWLRRPVQVVYNPVIDEHFYTKIKQTDAVHDWLENKSCPTFVAAAAHTGCKNQHMLLRAIRTCNEKRPIRLVLFGQGPLTPQYEAFIQENHLEDRIAIAGYTNNLPLAIKHSDGFIVSSDVESFSIVLVEALACGVPIISTNCHFGPPEILKNGQYGTLVPVGDDTAMASAILNVAEGGGIIPPEDSWKRFSLEAIVERYENVMRG